MKEHCLSKRKTYEHSFLSLPVQLKKDPESRKFRHAKPKM